MQNRPAPLLVATAVALAVLQQLGCNAEPPASVLPELPQLVTSSEPLMLKVAVTDAAGRTELAKPPFQSTILPKGIAELGADGALRCLKPGDAQLTVTVRGRQGSAPLRCRPIAQLEVPSLTRIDLAAGSFVLQAKAVAADGSEVKDVPIELSAPSGAPFRLEGLKLTPTELGQTELLVRAGSTQTRIAASVVRRVKPEPAAVDGGKRVQFSLPQGKYELIVHLNSTMPLKVEWPGSPQCDYQGGGSTAHLSSCALAKEGSVISDSPAFIDFGKTQVSQYGIELYEVR